MAVELNRRHVLAAIACVPVASCAGFGAVGYSWWDRPRGRGLKVMSSLEYGVAQAMAEGWMPRGGTPSLSGADAELGLFLDDIMSRLSPDKQKLMKLLFQAIDDLTVPSHGAHFRDLPVQTRSDLLTYWLNFDHWAVRQAVQSVLVLMSMGWTTHPDVVEPFRELHGCKHYGR